MSNFHLAKILRYTGSSTVPTCYSKERIDFEYVTEKQFGKRNYRLIFNKETILPWTFFQLLGVVVHVRETYMFKEVTIIGDEG